MDPVTVGRQVDFLKKMRVKHLNPTRVVPAQGPISACVQISAAVRGSRNNGPKMRATHKKALFEGHSPLVQNKSRASRGSDSTAPNPNPSPTPASGPWEGQWVCGQRRRPYKDEGPPPHRKGGPVGDRRGPNETPSPSFRHPFPWP